MKYGTPKPRLEIEEFTVCAWEVLWRRVDGKRPEQGVVVPHGSAGSMLMVVTLQECSQLSWRAALKSFVVSNGLLPLQRP